MLSLGSGTLALVAMCRKLQRQARPFRLPAATLTATLGFLSSNMMFYVMELFSALIVWMATGLRLPPSAWWSIPRSR